MVSSTTTIRQRPQFADWALLAILLLAAVLRCVPLSDSLWLDELHTAWVVASDGQLAQRAALGNQGPGYFLLQRICCGLLGTHEWSLRILSAVSGVFCVWLTHRVVRTWGCGRSLATLAAGLVAIDPNALYYSAEARAYGLVQCLALVHLAQLWALWTRSHSIWLWCGWVLSGLALFHLHFTAALIWLAAAVAAVCLLAARVRSQTHEGLLGIGWLTMLVGTLPSWPLLSQISTRRGNWEQFIGQPTWTELFRIYPLSVYLLVPALAVALMKGLAAFHLRHREELRVDKDSDSPDADLIQQPMLVPVVLCVCWLCVPLVSAWLATSGDVARLFLRRYLIGSSVSLALLSTLIVHAGQLGRRARIVAVVLVFFASWITISPLRVAVGSWPRALAHNRREDWRAAIAAIEPDDLPIVLCSGLIESDQWFQSEDPAKLAYCQFPLCSLYAVDRRREIVCLPRASTPTWQPQVRERICDRGAWLLIRGRETQCRDVTSAVLKTLGQRVIAEPVYQGERLVLSRLQPIRTPASLDDGARN